MLPCLERLGATALCRSGVRRRSALCVKSFGTVSGHEQVTVPVKGNGTISLDIYHPHSVPAHGITKVALYLPRGPLLYNPDNDIANASTLRALLPWTVVQINYRLAQAHPYPTPVHDVLAGYDWIYEHLLPKRIITRTGRPTHIGQIDVFGELLGGSLAAMLALTECRRGEAGVVAAAVSNPLVDWVLPESGDSGYSKSSISRFGDHHPGLSTVDLLNARGKLFKKPDAYFDPFASPILFFRTAGQDTPRPAVSSVLDELEQLSLLDREDFFREQQLLSGISNAQAPAVSLPELVTTTTSRKASRLFPSKGLKLVLPTFHIFTGSASLLQDQAKELTTALRKSVIRQYRARKPSSEELGRKVLLDEEVEEMCDVARDGKAEEDAVAASQVQLTTTSGLGLWDGSKAGRARLEAAAQWTKARLA